MRLTNDFKMTAGFNCMTAQNRTDGDTKGCLCSETKVIEIDIDWVSELNCVFYRASSEDEMTTNDS